MKRILLTLCLSVFALCGLKAQSNVLKIQMNGGEEIIWTSEKLNNIYFYGDTTLVVVESENYFTHSYDVKEIRKIYFEAGESLSEMNFGDASFVYPNPAKNNIRIVGVENQEIEFFSADGKLVMKERYEGKDIDVSSLQKGFYLIKTNSQTLKFNKI